MTNLNETQQLVLKNHAETYQVNVDELTKAVDYLKFDRFKDGMVAYDRFKFLGNLAWTAYSADKKTYVETVKGVFLNGLTKDEVNYSIRLAGHVKSDKLDIIDTDDMKKWLGKLETPIFSCRRMVTEYANRDNEPDAEKTAFEKLLQAVQSYRIKAEKMDTLTVDQKKQLDTEIELTDKAIRKIVAETEKAIEDAATDITEPEVAAMNQIIEDSENK